MKLLSSSRYSGNISRGVLTKRTIAFILLFPSTASILSLIVPMVIAFILCFVSYKNEIKAFMLGCCLFLLGCTVQYFFLLHLSFFIFPDSILEVNSLTDHSFVSVNLFVIIVLIINNDELSLNCYFLKHIAL